MYQEKLQTNRKIRGNGKSQRQGLRKQKLKKIYLEEMESSLEVAFGALSPIQFQQKSTKRLVMFSICSKRYPVSSILAPLAYSFSIRLRYAPSPTGPMHLGGLRTALFNYLYARHHNGTFIVRIQDTDKKREVQGSLQNIFTNLKWLNITVDESMYDGGEYGPYIQSQRLHIYKDIEKQLLKSNKAYPCFCKEEEHEGVPYSGKCRNLALDEIKTRIMNKEEYAVRIKSDLMELPPYFEDEVFGKLEFKELDDFVVVRKNGWPTFHLSNVVDDWQMKITHVMRGEEWLTNTNKHIYLYRVLGAEVPKFVHLPLIKAMNGKKLAKRDPQYSIQSLKDKHYQTQAIRSFIYGLGLKQEIKSEVDADGENKQKKKAESHLKLQSNGEMIAKFDIARISRVPVKFDILQLDALNKQAIRARWRKVQQDPSQLKYFIDMLHYFVPSSQPYPEDYKRKVFDLMIDRFGFIGDVVNFRYFFQEPDYFSQQATKDIKKIFGGSATLSKKQTSNATEEPSFQVNEADSSLLSQNKKIIHNLLMILTHIIDPSSFSDKQLAKHISAYLFQSEQIKNEDLFHLMRYIVTGKKSGPNITEACGLIGQDKITERISRFSML